MPNMRTGSIYDNVGKDDSLPLDIDSIRKETNNEDNNTPGNEINDGNLTPLQRMKRDKAVNTSGMVVGNDELEKGAIKAPSSDMVMTEQRENEFEKAIADLDDTTRKREAVTLMHQPKDQTEYIQMMLEIDSVHFDENGNASFIGNDGKPIQTHFVKIREEGEPIFNEASLNADNPNYEKPEDDDKSHVSESSETVVSDEDAKVSAKKKVVEILIDKTGYGTDFIFNDKEKEDIETAETLKINEIRTVDLKSLKTKRSNRSFQDYISEYNNLGSKSTICFPASGFRAQMKGLTYGEYADVALSMDNVTYDQYQKRLSIIYNKMVNISTGPFDSYEEFLKSFAYTDIYLAIYALFVATEQEKRDIRLHCGNSKCNRTFYWEYSTRSLLRLDRCPDEFLDNMKEIATADPADYEKIREDAPVNNSKIIELPDSKFIVEIGIASAYDFVNNFIPLLNQDKFEEVFGDDPSNIYKSNLVLLTSIRAVHVPDGEGGYIECIGYKDILDAIYNISPTEIKIIAAYAAKIQSGYVPVFSFGNVTCPHCGNVTNNMDINIDELVFQTYRRLINTEINLNNIQGL